MKAVIWDRLYFVYEPGAMNPNTREEVSIMFSAAVNDSRWVGAAMKRIPGYYGEFIVHATTRASSLSPPFLSNNEGKLAAEMRLLRCPWALLLVWLSSPVGKDWDRNLLECGKPCSSKHLQKQIPFLAAEKVSGRRQHPEGCFALIFLLEVSSSSCLDLFVSTGTLLTSVPVCRWLMSAVWVISAISQTHMNTSMCIRKYGEHMCPYMTAYADKQTCAHGSCWLSAPQFKHICSLTSWKSVCRLLSVFVCSVMTKMHLSVH